MHGPEADQPTGPGYWVQAPTGAAGALTPLRLRAAIHEEPAQLVAGADAELAEDVAQVVVDRAGAEEELCGHLAVGGALGDETCDLELLAG